MSLNENRSEAHSQLIHTFQADRQQLSKIKEQNKILASLHDKVTRKDSEIEELQKLVKKYKKYYEEYDRVAAMLSQKNKDCEKMEREGKLMMQELEKAIEENKAMQEGLLVAERNKHEHVKERNNTDKRLRDIQDTFREYQDECRNKEKQLLTDLDKAYRQIKEMNEKCEGLQGVKFENEQLKTKISQCVQRQRNQNSVVEGAQDPNSLLEFDLYHNSRSAQLPQNGTGIPSINLSHTAKSGSSRQRSPNAPRPQQHQEMLIINGANVSTLPDSQLIELLKKELNAKQIELQRSKNLNHELSIEFDKSVNKICEFEKELSAYRKENHELKRTLSLFVEKEQYEKMHKDKIKTVQNRWGESESEECAEDRQSEDQIEEEEESWTADEGYFQASANMSRNRNYHISTSSQERMR